MNNTGTIAVVVLLIVGIVGFLYFRQLENQRAALAASQNPWNQLGSGVGSLISGIGGLVTQGQAS